MRCLSFLFCMHTFGTACMLSLCLISLSFFGEFTTGSQESLIDFYCARQRHRRGRGHFQIAVNRWRAEFNYRLPHILCRFPSDRQDNFIYITPLTQTGCRHYMAFSTPFNALLTTSHESTCRVKVATN